ncbi:hypothetical protein JessAGP_009 [Caulobacter phage Jess A]|nr:hypothetical protein JessAGP_009 [Caulobacter phage Jess A]QNH91662.1 hypothetical protein SR18_gp011 [Caulobacter phage SR18]WCA46418.1 hypothetical protein [Caulobacter phage RapA]
MNIHFTPEEQAAIGQAWKDACIGGTGILKLTIRGGLERVAPEGVVLKTFSLAGLVRIAELRLWKGPGDTWYVRENDVTGAWRKAPA